MALVDEDQGIQDVAKALFEARTASNQPDFNTFMGQLKQVPAYHPVETNKTDLPKARVGF